LRRIAWCAFIICAVSLFSAARTPDAVSIPRVHRPPKLRDFIDGTPREGEISVTKFWQLEPVNGEAASQPTVAYLSYDDKNLYVGLICKDDPSKIRTRLARRDDIGKDDRITINIDSFHDKKHSYWFDVNPYGVQSDGIYTDDQFPDNSWDALWYSEARLTPDGYVVLETIPFRSLRFRAGEQQDWGFTLCRYITRNNETSCSTRISREDLFHKIPQYDSLVIPENISPGRNMQFIPYGMFSGGRYLDSARGYQTPTEQRVGMDAKMVLKDAFTLDLTVNPDFSQVESDEPQTTINQRYEVIYSERRPFFTENASLFKLPEEIFFSRRIVNPQFGARLTGTRGRWSVGLLAADDRSPGQQLGTATPGDGRRALNEVFRLERAFERQTYAGFTFVNTDLGSAYNRLASIDARTKFGSNWIGNLQIARSNTRFRDGSTLDGQDLMLKISNTTQHGDFTSTYTDRSPGFRAALGNFRRVDMRELESWGNYRWRPRSGAVVAFGPGFSQNINWDHQGRLQEWWAEPSFSVDMLRMTFLSVRHTEAYELYQNIGFRTRRSRLEARSELAKHFSFYANYEFGSRINYYPGSGLLPFAARSTNADGGLTYRPVPQIRIDQSYIYTRLATDSARLPQNAPVSSATIFNNHILRTKVNYQFTRALALRTIIDYNGVLPNTSLVSLEKSKRIGADILLTYLIHPGTAFYAGYSDTYENVSFNPLVNPALLRTQFPGTNTGRQVFVKMSYLFRN
jgi:hypothetical protein